MPCTVWALSFGFLLNYSNQPSVLPKYSLSPVKRTTRIVDSEMTSSSSTSWQSCQSLYLWLGKITQLSQSPVELHCISQHPSGHSPGARSSPMFCYGFRVERHVSWKRVWDMFSLVWWVCSEMSAQSAATYINHTVLKRHNVSKWTHLISVISSPFMQQFNCINIWIK